MLAQRIMGYRNKENCRVLFKDRVSRNAPTNSASNLWTDSGFSVSSWNFALKLGNVVNLYQYYIYR